MGEEGKAAGWYEGAIALCPRRPEAYAAYGWQLVMAGDAKKALELLKRGEASGMQQDDNVEKLVTELKRRGFE